jgi:hemoglobin
MQINEPGAEPAFGVGDASFQAAGGEQGLERLVNDFYYFMGILPEARAIRSMHPHDLTMAKDKLARFLSGWLGGPRRYAEKYGAIHIPKAHAHLPIGPAERDEWLLCMRHALEQQPYSDEFKKYLLEQLAIPAERCRNIP